MANIDIGIIGGSGFYEIEGFSQLEELVVDTPFGKPSDAYILGELHGVRLAFLPRHGRGHLLLPSELNYRANIYGFKSLGVSNTHPWALSVATRWMSSRLIAVLCSIVTNARRARDW